MHPAGKEAAIHRQPFFDSTALARISAQAVLILALFAPTLGPSSAHALDILIGSSQRGTFNYDASRILCRIINSQTEDLNCSVVAAGDELHSSDQIHTLTNVQNGALDLGVIDSAVQFDAVNRRGRFEFFDIELDSIRSLFSLYGVPLTVVSRGGQLESIADIRGKRLNIGNPGSRQRTIMDELMRASGWARRDFKLIEELPAAQSQDMLALCFGAVDALVRFNVHPNADTMHMVNLCDAALVDVSGAGVDKLTGQGSFFSSMSIPAGLYSSNDAPVSTFGLLDTVIATEDLDEETAYTIVEAVFENLERLRASHPAFAALTPEHMHSQGLSAPLHPGAMRYFRERGWTR
jgi:TRAP transporter TAXI family solute receptor